MKQEVKGYERSFYLIARLIETRKRVEVMRTSLQRSMVESLVRKEVEEE